MPFPSACATASLEEEMKQGAPPARMKRGCTPGQKKEVSEQEGETLRKQESAHAPMVNRQSQGLFRMKV